MLRPEDRLSVVTFSDKGEVVFPLQRMTTEGQADAMIQLDRVTHRGRTNIWDGLLTAMEVLRTPPSSDGGSESMHRHKTVMLYVLRSHLPWPAASRARATIAAPK